MKKLGIPIVLMLLLAILSGATGARAADRTFVVVNDSPSTVTVAIVWSGGGVSPLQLDPSTTYEGTVPAAIDSVKVTATGRCREATVTFNPQRVDRATLRCRDNAYMITLETTKPKPAS